MNNSGFTLLELLVVVVIIGILAGFVAPNFLDQPENARRTQAEVQVRAISEALEMYKLDNRRYPTTEQGLQALVTKPTTEPVPPKWKDGGYMKSLPSDPWDSPYVYLQPGVNGAFDLLSYGADGQAGGSGNDADITNWE